jgi:hypothetical protein
MTIGAPAPRPILGMCPRPRAGMVDGPEPILHPSLQSEVSCLIMNSADRLQIEIQAFNELLLKG